MTPEPPIIITDRLRVFRQYVDRGEPFQPRVFYHAWSPDDGRQWPACFAVVFHNDQLGAVLESLDVRPELRGNGLRQHMVEIIEADLLTGLNVSEGVQIHD